MSNYATDIFQNDILNCYIYLQHNEIPTSPLSTAQLPSQHRWKAKRQFCISQGKPQIGKAAKRGLWEPGQENANLGCLFLNICSLLLWYVVAFIVARCRDAFLPSFPPSLCYCSLKCMNVAGRCCVGCACKLQYNITLQRCSVSVCCHKFISYFLSFVKYPPTSLYK